MSVLFKRTRSEFWVKINYDPDKYSYTISTGNNYTCIIGYFFPQLVWHSPTRWRESKTHIGMSNLWLPNGCYDQQSIYDFKNWCQNVIENRLWLGLNKNIEQFFDRELDFCIASDFNFNTDTGNERTEIGEAEYQIKYHSGELDRIEIEAYCSTLINKMMDNCKYIPVDNSGDWYVSAMPADETGKRKFAWWLAKEISVQLNLPFIEASLKCEKPQMKQLSVSNKIEAWKCIYESGAVQINKDVKEKKILIIDDLYQSGATMWQYAMFLKRNGANMIFGNVCVKSLRDSDNKNI